MYRAWEDSFAPQHYPDVKDAGGSEHDRATASLQPPGRADFASSSKRSASTVLSPDSPLPAAVEIREQHFGVVQIKWVYGKDVAIQHDEIRPLA